MYVYYIYIYTGVRWKRRAHREEIEVFEVAIPYPLSSTSLITYRFYRILRLLRPAKVPETERSILSP